MPNYRVVMIHPDVAGGVEQALQTVLNEMANSNFRLASMIPYREGVLLVFVRED